MRTGAGGTFSPVAERYVPAPGEGTKEGSAKQEEDEHLRADRGTERGLGAGAEPQEHLKKYVGMGSDIKEEGSEKGLVEKAKDNLKGL